MTDSLVLSGRSPVTDEEVVAFGRSRPGWWLRVRAHSLGWAVARDEGRLVEFTNVACDGADPAFLLDPVVALEHRRRGVAVRMVHQAVERSREAGCSWLHVDFEEHLRNFYLGACGFRPTAAGLMDLRSGDV